MKVVNSGWETTEITKETVNDRRTQKEIISFMTDISQNR